MTRNALSALVVVFLAAVACDALFPIIPLLPKNPDTCCVDGITHVDLRNGGLVSTIPGVTVTSGPVAQGGSNGDISCNMQAVLQVNFATLTSTPCSLTDFCVYGPYCGRRMLKVELELSSGTRSGFMFNIGDSKSNDGYGGDGNDQTNDAEIQGKYPNIITYGSDDCNRAILSSLSDVITSGSVNKVTLYVSDKHVRITNDNGVDVTLCHRCLFALNGQADSSRGGVNQDVFIALNRVVSYAGRNGVGVCSAKLSWMCPW